MTTTKRESVVAKVRALMAKTVDAGCTEGEALSALTKARQLMDAHEVTEADLVELASGKLQATMARRKSKGHHRFHEYLSRAVADFCDCRVWKRRVVGVRDAEITMCGLPEDVETAGVLLDALAGHVKRELKAHLAAVKPPQVRLRATENGFIAGCVGRISERLQTLTEESRAAAAANSRALVVAKGALIADAMVAAGILVSASRKQSRRADPAAYAAGTEAGDRAILARGAIK